MLYLPDSTRAYINGFSISLTGPFGGTDVVMVRPSQRRLWESHGNETHIYGVQRSLGNTHNSQVYLIDKKPKQAAVSWFDWRYEGDPTHDYTTDNLVQRTSFYHDLVKNPRCYWCGVPLKNYPDSGYSNSWGHSPVQVINHWTKTENRWLCDKTKTIDDMEHTAEHIILKFHKDQNAKAKTFGTNNIAPVSVESLDELVMGGKFVPASLGRTGRKFKNL